MTLILIALFICIVIARYSVITGLIILAIFLTAKVFYLGYTAWNTPRDCQGFCGFISPEQGLSLMLGSVGLVLLCIWFVINHLKK